MSKYTRTTEIDGELDVYLPEGEVDPNHYIDFVAKVSLRYEPSDREVGIFDDSYVVEDVKVIKALLTNRDSGMKEEVVLSPAQLEAIEEFCDEDNQEYCDIFDYEDDYDNDADRGMSADPEPADWD